jgi:hypothetical protein
VPHGADWVQYACDFNSTASGMRHRLACHALSGIKMYISITSFPNHYCMVLLMWQGKLKIVLLHFILARLCLCCACACMLATGGSSTRHSQAVLCSQCMLLFWTTYCALLRAYCCNIPGGVQGMAIMAHSRDSVLRGLREMLAVLQYGYAVCSGQGCVVFWRCR